MSVENFLNYESYIKYMDKQVAIWGQPATMYVPNRSSNLGYEDTSKLETDRMGADESLSTQYEKKRIRIWINFTIPKKVFYKFNWFPDEADELCMAFTNSDSELKENDYVRTAVPEATSIWGDMIFKVVKVQDTGLSQVLQRAYFLKPAQNADLNKRLGF